MESLHLTPAVASNSVDSQQLESLINENRRLQSLIDQYRAWEQSYYASFYASQSMQPDAQPAEQVVTTATGNTSCASSSNNGQHGSSVTETFELVDTNLDFAAKEEDFESMKREVETLRKEQENMVKLFADQKIKLTKYEELLKQFGHEEQFDNPDDDLINPLPTSTIITSNSSKVHLEDASKTSDQTQSTSLIETENVPFQTTESNNENVVSFSPQTSTQNPPVPFTPLSDPFSVKPQVNFSELQYWPVHSEHETITSSINPYASTVQYSNNYPIYQVPVSNQSSLASATPSQQPPCSITSAYNSYSGCVEQASNVSAQPVDNLTTTPIQSYFYQQPPQAYYANPLPPKPQ